MKTFIANSVRLPKVDNKYRATNNNCQYSILCRAKSKKAVARLLNPGCDEKKIKSSYNHLREFCGIHECSETHKNIPTKDNVIYFYPDWTKSGYYDEWIEYIP